MTKTKPSASLDNWRDYFRRSDSDIFGIIDHAIMVAAADCPKEFKSRRDRIAELLFSCRVSRCIGCDHLELSIAGDEEANHGRKTVEKDGVRCGVATDDGGHGGDYDGRQDERKLNNNQIVSNHTYGFSEALSDEQETCVIVDQVIRIKDILLNKEDEPSSVLLESLRKLESMSMSVDVLKDTEIGKAVNGLRRHNSDQISRLAKTLFAEWKELVDQWMKTPKEITGTEGTPESANLSVVDEVEEEEEEELAFPSPPHDLELFANELHGFELSQILDCLDCDGNPRDNFESKHESSSWRPDGTNEANVVGRYNKDQPMRKEETDVRPMKHSSTDFDEPRKQPKQSREQMVPAIRRRPLVSAKEKQKLAGPQQDKLKDLDQDAKFEFAKRKLQESYQQHENAKRQRTIQVLETIPKQGKARKPQFKRPSRR